MPKFYLKALMAIFLTILAQSSLAARTQESQCRNLEKKAIKAQFAKKCAGDLKRYHCLLDKKCKIDNESERSYDLAASEGNLQFCFSNLPLWKRYIKLKCSKNKSLFFMDFTPSLKKD